jgi:hypothetical protein
MMPGSNVLARLEPVFAVWRRIAPAFAFALVMLALIASTYALFRDVAESDRVRERFDYPPEQIASYDTIRKEFRPRIASTWIVSKFHTEDRKAMRDRIAAYSAVWFAVACVAYAIADRRAAPFVALGTFAAVYYCCTPRGGDIWHPWDMPVLALSAVGLACALRGWIGPLMLTVFVGVTFKETLVLMGLLPLFMEGRSLRRRLAWCAAMCLVGYGIRLGIEIALDNPLGPNAMSYRLEDKEHKALRCSKNLHQLVRTTWNHVLLANLGTAFTLVLLPAKRPVLRGYKVVAALLLLGLLFAGNFGEMRTFLDAVPAGMFVLYDLFFVPGEATASAP